METNYTLINKLIKRAIPQLLPSSIRISGGNITIPPTSPSPQPSPLNTPDVSEDESEDELEIDPVSPLRFKPTGHWHGENNYYVYDIRDGDFLVYKLSWAPDEKYKIQYDIRNRIWKDRGTHHPHEVVDRGIDVLISADDDGFDELGIFDNPYYEAPPEPTPDPTPPATPAGSDDESAPPVTSSGGTVSQADGYTIHTFTSSGDFVVSENVDVEYLVVAGGGGGGLHNGGGGGAGSFMEGLGFNTEGGSVIIGGGGSGSTVSTQKGGNGSDSSFGSIISNGGGGGGSIHTIDGANGGSGGAGGRNSGNRGITNQAEGGNHGGNGGSGGGGGGGE